MSIPRALARLTLKYVVSPAHAFILRKNHPQLQAIAETTNEIECARALMYDWDTDALVRVSNVFTQNVNLAVDLWILADALGDWKMIEFANRQLGADTTQRGVPSVTAQRWFGGPRVLTIKNARLSAEVRAAIRISTQFGNAISIKTIFRTTVRINCRVAHRYALLLLEALYPPPTPVFLALARTGGSISDQSRLFDFGTRFLSEAFAACGRQDFDKSVAQATERSEKEWLRKAARVLGIQTA